MSEVLLSVEGLRVEYEDTTAVDDVSFEVEAGMIYGLIGPNGAGKTSVMSAIATLVEPTHGTIKLCGVDIAEEPSAALPRLGFMSDQPPLYEDLTVYEFLDCFASAYGVAKEERSDRIGKLAAQVNLVEKLHSPAGQLSRGMKQRLFLAKTMLHEPRVLILDEPASGLDPHARLELAEVIRGLGDEGRAVLVSSHILSELADFCNSVGILELGQMKVSGRIDEILANRRTGRQMLGSLVHEDGRFEAFLQGKEGISNVEMKGAAFRFSMAGEEAEAAGLLRSAIEAGFAVAEFHTHQEDLQELFLEVSSGRVS